MQGSLFKTEKFSKDNCLPHEHSKGKASNSTDKHSSPINDYRNPKTVNNYDLDCVISALQKAIRRGEEEKAMYWMEELIDSGYIQYFWRRLSIIVVEDIGLANPFAVTLIESLFNLNEKFIKKGIKEKLQCSMAVLYLCRSPKSREVDHALDYLGLKKKDGWKLQIPPEAMDKHTRIGKKMLKTDTEDYEQKAYEKFFYEGILLNKPLAIQNNKYKSLVWEKRKLDPLKKDLKHATKSKEEVS